MKLRVLLSFVFISGWAQAQFQQNQSPWVQEEGDVISYRYKFADYYNNHWLYTVRDLGVVKRESGADDFLYSFKYRNEGEGYTFDVLDADLKGNVVASNHLSNRIAISRDGGESFEEIVSESNYPVWLYNDTLYSLEVFVPSKVARLILSADFGQNWEEIALIDYDELHTSLHGTSEGHPVLSNFNPAQQETTIYEVRGKELKQLSTPFSEVIQESITGNFDNIFLIARQNNESVLYSYNRLTEVWSDMSNQFLPYEFVPVSTQVSSEGSLYVIGTRTLLTIEEVASYSYNGGIMSEMSIPAAPDVQMYEGFRCEGSHCVVQVNNDFYQSENSGQTWELVSFFNESMDAGITIPGGYLYLKGGKINRVVNGIRNVLYTPNTVTNEPRFIDAGERLILSSKNGVGHNLLWSSFDNGVSWDLVVDSYYSESELKSAVNDELIVYRVAEKSYWMQKSVSAPMSWWRLNQWDLFGDAKVVAKKGRYAVVPESNAEILIASDSSYNSFISSYVVSGAAEGAEVLDIAKTTNGIVALVKNVQPDIAGFIYELIHLSDLPNSQWVTYGSTTSPLDYIAYPDALILGFRKSNEKDEFYVLNSGEIIPLFDELPQSTIITGFSGNSDELHVFSKNAGLWNMSRNSLSFTEPQFNTDGQQVWVYPNPVRSSETLHFVMDEPGDDAILTVYNLLGEEVIRRSFVNNDEMKLTLNSGAYVYTLTGEAGISSGKILVVD